MKLSNRINIYFILLAVAACVCGGMYWFAAARVGAAQLNLEQALSTSDGLVDKTRAELFDHLGYIQSKVLARSTGTANTLFATERLDKGAIKTRLNPADEAKLNDAPFFAALLENIDKIEQVKNEIFSYLGDPNIDQAKYDKINQSIAQRLIPIQNEVLQNLNELRDYRVNQLEAARLEVNSARMLEYGAFGGFALLTLIAALLGMMAVQGGLVLPFKQLLERMTSRQKLIVADNEVGQIAAYLNRVHEEQVETEHLIEKLAQGGAEKPFSGEKVRESLADGLNSIRARFNRFQDEIFQRDTEIKGLNDRNNTVSAEARQNEAYLKTQLNAYADGFAQLILLPDKSIVRANSLFLSALGYSIEELKAIKPTDLLGAVNGAPFTMWKELAEGHLWHGMLQVKSREGAAYYLAAAAIPIRNPAGAVESYAIMATDVTALQQEFSRVKQDIQDKSQKVDKYEKELNNIQHDLGKSKAEQVVLQQAYETQKEVENRLWKQQTALQNLTRDPDLKAGRVTEALRTITEVTVAALDEDEAALWLFTSGGEKLLCLDIFRRSSMQHTNGVEIESVNGSTVLAAMRSGEVLAVQDVQHLAPEDAFVRHYLTPSEANACLAAPVHLSGVVIGMMSVQHKQQPRDWAIDEQNFLIAVADIVSLSMEQGNRLIMEHELRITLEESQALDEEIRQNAEEIEATNEEMRRTQVELRGQISALNNAAIVSEVNLDGMVSYVNREFLNAYRYIRKQILGKKLSILKSGEHDDAFFAEMWGEISAGKVWKGEIRNKTGDDTFVWVSQTITPVLGLDGQPFKFIAVAFDITRQKLQSQRIKEALKTALEQEEQLLASTARLLETNEEMKRTQIELFGQISALNNSSLVFETDMSGNITSVNDEFLRVSNYGDQDLIGRHFMVLKSGRQPDTIYNDQWRTVQGGAAWRGELEFKSHSGKFFWVMTTNNPVKDENGDPIKCINVLFDITEQKEQEFRLKKQQSALLEITAHPAVKEGNIKLAFQVIAQKGLETLAVKRASIWLYIEQGKRVRCTSVVQEDAHEHSEGTILDTEMYPIYFRTLERERIIPAQDALGDPRTKELAFTLFKPMGIQSVMDVSIRQGNKPVGIMSFEFSDGKREWTLDEQSFATSLADTISLVLEQKERQLNSQLRQAYAQLEEANREMMRQKAAIEEATQDLNNSIKYAKRIQTNILPSKDSLDRHLGKDNYFIVHRQRDTVGGDFYWIEKVGDKLICVVADGTGHGVPGAFLTLIGYLMLNQIVMEQGVSQPGEILNLLHKGVRIALKQDDEDAKHTSRDGMDVAVCTVDMVTHKCEYAGANLPFYYYQDWEIHEIKPTKKSVGGEQLEEERIYKNHELQLKPGDALYMYTDGFVDQFGGPEEKRFSTKRFRDLILRTQHESMSTQRAMLNMEWKDWKEDREQLDDVTVYGLRIL